MGTPTRAGDSLQGKNEWQMWEHQVVPAAELKYVDFVGQQCYKFKRYPLNPLREVITTIFASQHS